MIGSLGVMGNEAMAVLSKVKYKRFSCLLVFVGDEVMVNPSKIKYGGYSNLRVAVGDEAMVVPLQVKDWGSAASASWRAME